MTEAAPQIGSPNAGDGKAVSDNGRRGTENSRVGRLGRSLRPARRFQRGSETEIVWQATFRGLKFERGKPYGECKWTSWGVEISPYCIDFESKD